MDPYNAALRATVVSISTDTPTWDCGGHDVKQIPLTHDHLTLVDDADLSNGFIEAVAAGISGVGSTRAEAEASLQQVLSQRALECINA